MTKTNLKRRRFLEIVGLAGGAVALRTAMGPGVAQASVTDPKFMLSVYFQGGWDQLLTLDPRSNTHFTATNAGTTRILPGYERCADPYVKSVLSTTPSGIQTRGNLTFGPAMPPELLKHYVDLCVLRGVSMDTLTHEVGRRYFTTGKFPRGLSANGSALAAHALAEGVSQAVSLQLQGDLDDHNDWDVDHATKLRTGFEVDAYTETFAFLRHHLGPRRKFAAAGRSYGGRVASMAVARGMPAVALVFYSYPLHPPGKPDELRVVHWPQIKVPCLFLAGTEDEHCDLSLLKKNLKKLRARADVQVVEGGDHALEVPARTSDDGKKHDETEVLGVLSSVVSSWLRSL